MQGPRPSFTHMTFPQFRQFGAAASNGCRVAIQLHFLLASSCLLGFVESSSDRIALSSSFNVVDAPCIDVPPVMLTLVLGPFLLGAGDEVRELSLEEVGVFFLEDRAKSEIREPAAEGGALGVGACMASGF